MYPRNELPPPPLLPLSSAHPLLHLPLKFWKKNPGGRNRIKATLLFRCRALLAHGGVPPLHDLGADSHSLPGVSAVVEAGALLT